MINATEAAALYTQPPLTEQEIEEKIRRVAADRGCTIFEKSRLTEESRKQLLVNGFKLDLIGSDYIVSWERESGGSRTNE